MLSSNINIRLFLVTLFENLKTKTTRGKRINMAFVTTFKFLIFVQMCVLFFMNSAERRGLSQTAISLPSIVR